MDWFPTFVDAAGEPNITDELLKGWTYCDRNYKNHLDGYDQMAAITGQGPSTRHEIFYLGESTIGAVRIDDYKYRFIDQPQGPDWVENFIPERCLLSPTCASIRSSAWVFRKT